MLDALGNMVGLTTITAFYFPNTITSLLRKSLPKFCHHPLPTHSIPLIPILLRLICLTFNPSIMPRTNSRCSSVTPKRHMVRPIATIKSSSNPSTRLSERGKRIDGMLLDLLMKADWRMAIGYCSGMEVGARILLVCL